MKKYYCLLSLLVLLCSGCRTDNGLALENCCSWKQLYQKIAGYEKEFDATIGLTILGVKDRKSYGYKQNHRFPMMSTFKSLAYAAALKKSEVNKSFLQRQIVVQASDIVTWSPVMKTVVGKKVSLGSVCDAMMLMSDNCAANIVLRELEGPEEVTKFLRNIGDKTSRCDRFEPELGSAIVGDPRDTTTPQAMATTLQKLLYGDCLSEASKEKLLDRMINNKVSDSLFRAVLPAGISIADRSGAAKNGSRSITAAVWGTDDNPVIICLYITNSKATFEELNLIIREVGRTIFSQLAYP